MEIKSKRQLQLITLSRQLEIGWNPVGFLRPPSAISGGVWAGKFGCCGWGCLSCDSHLWLLGCAWHRWHHENIVIVSWQILRRSFEFRFLEKKEAFCTWLNFVVLFPPTYFPISSHPHQSLVWILWFWRWEKVTFQEVLDISSVYRGIEMWPRKCQMLDVQGGCRWAGVE